MEHTQERREPLVEINEVTSPNGVIYVNINVSILRRGREHTLRLSPSEAENIAKDILRLAPQAHARLAEVKKKPRITKDGFKNFNAPSRKPR